MWTCSGGSVYTVCQDLIVFLLAVCQQTGKIMAVLMSVEVTDWTAAGKVLVVDHLRIRRRISGFQVPYMLNTPF
jgi:hypothetical protein